MLAHLAKVVLNSRLRFQSLQHALSTSWNGARQLCTTTDDKEQDSAGDTSHENRIGKEEVPSVELSLENNEEGEAQPEGSKPEDAEQEFAYYEAAHVPGRYPSRAEIGNFSDPGTFDYELKHDVEAVDSGPDADPLYDLGEWLKKHMPEVGPTPHIRGMLKEALDDDETKRLAAYLYNAELQAKENKKPSIFRWEVQYVLAVGEEDHPANRKVKMRVYLKELQREYNLTDSAIQHIIAICEKRYNPNTGELTLVSEKYRYREDNRRHAMEMMTSLIEEGRRKFPNLHSESSLPAPHQEEEMPNTGDAAADGTPEVFSQAA